MKLCFHSTTMYSCEYCAKPFRRKCDLLRHKREVHEWLLRFECEKCEKKFKRKPDLERHKRTCCVCHRCHIQFKSPQEKKSHVCEPAMKKARIVNEGTCCTGAGVQEFNPQQSYRRNLNQMK